MESLRKQATNDMNYPTRSNMPLISPHHGPRLATARTVSRRYLSLFMGPHLLSSCAMLSCLVLSTAVVVVHVVHRCPRATVRSLIS